MTFVNRLKPTKDCLLEPVCLVLEAVGVTPNIVTAAVPALSVPAGLAAASGHHPADIALFDLGACCDALDGSLARVAGRSSEFGLYLDGAADRLSEATLVAGAVAGSVLLLASRVRNHRRGLDSDAALIGRPGRLALLVAGLFAPYPANAVLFGANALLCALSDDLVLASAGGRRPGPGRRG